jgi:Glycosyltransferase family 87
MRRRLLWAAALAYSLLHFAITGVRQPLANFYGDFLASFPSWTMAFFFGRLDLYNGSLAEAWGPPPIWHYGPVLHAITAPLFAFHSLRSAYLAWLFVNYLLVVLTAVIAIRIIDKGRPTMMTSFVVVIAFCNFNPLYEALTQRTIELFELLLLFAAYALLRGGRETTAGAAVGTAAMAKFLPLIFLPWFVLKRKWDALGGALAVIFPVAVVTEFVLEWENSGILIQLGQGSFLKGELNQSLAGMVARLLAWTHSRLPLATTSRIAILVALLAFSALMFRVRRREGIEDLEYGLLAAAMVLLPPHNQNYYFVFLLLPYLLLYARYRTRWSWRTALLALSFVLVAIPVPLSIVQRFTGLDAFSLYLRAGIPFLGATLLVVVLLAEIGMSCAVSASEQPCPSKKPSRISALS